MTEQYQHVIPKFLLENFTDNTNKTHIYKCENDKWTDHNIDNTGGDNCVYGDKDCSLEKCFSKIESDIASVLKCHKYLDKKDESYLKLFIVLMALRSPSKERNISNAYNSYMKNNEALSEKDLCNKKDRMLSSYEDDPEMKKITDQLLQPFDDSDNSKFYPDTIKGLLLFFPKISKSFGVSIFDSDYNLIIGETPTVSVNLDTNVIKTNGEEAGLTNENVFYWQPLAYNKVAFMYKTANISAVPNRKLRKQETDILNYFQKIRSPYFYSRIKNIDVPELPPDFIWVKNFNYIFGYKSRLCEKRLFYKKQIGCSESAAR